MRLAFFVATACAVSALTMFACSSSDDASTNDDFDANSSADAMTNDAGISEGSAIDSSKPVPLEPIHFLGRFDTSDDAGPRFAFPGSAISATFTGTGIDANLTSQGDNYIDVVIDGANPRTMEIPSSTAQPTMLAKNLTPGTHTVTLTKITESYQGIMQLEGLTPVGGAIVPSPFPFSRRIEMIGDSITCGYGVLGVGPGCPFTAATESEDQAWGALTAKKLNAMNTAIAYSGKGMFQNYDGSKNDVMPEIWLRTFADDSASTWDTAEYTPDVVVINLGTNDFATGDPGTDFVDAYNTFIDRLRVAYPGAYVVCVVGPMLDGTALTQAQSYVNSVVTNRNNKGDTKVSYLSLPVQVAADGYGCDSHPSQITQGKMADLLAAHLHTVLGW